MSVDWKLNFGRMFRHDLEFFRSARGFELGSYPYAHVHALKNSLDLITGLGLRNIQRHNHELVGLLADYLGAGSVYRITSAPDRKHRSSILAFTCEDARGLFERLRRKRIIASFREGAIRVSIHLFNNRSDINRLIELLDNN